GVTGGTWSSSNTGFATVVATTGVVTGVLTGMPVIKHTLPSGYVRSFQVTVNPLLATTGPSSACQGQTVTLINYTTGRAGVWSSSNTLVATIVSTTGIVSGVSAGTATIFYTTPPGCVATKAITVNTMTPVTGVAKVCSGQTTTLSNGVTGGTWSSSNTGFATVVATTGVVTGVLTGMPVIYYTSPLGCVNSVLITVNPLLATTGASSICQGQTVTLVNSTTGSAGVWSSSNTLVATVVSTTGITGGVSAGTATIFYTTPPGCVATKTITVNSMTPIMGVAKVCAGQTTTLSNGVTGGTWSSSNTGFATVVATTGVVTGVLTGMPVIYYTSPIGCVSSVLITVNPLLATTGPSGVCQDQTVTLVNYTTGGAGVWSSSNTLVATVVSTIGITGGVSAGTATIFYTTLPGCVATTTITVNPITPVTGVTTVCVGQTTTLSDGVTGGAWSSSNTGFATVVATTGVVTGVLTGTPTIYYILPSGCIGSVPVTICVGRAIDTTNTGTSINSTTATISDIRIFPNPNKGTFNVEILSTAADEPVQVIITNVAGEKVKEFVTTTNQNMEIKLSAIPGMYFVSAITSEGRYNAKVVISVQ
ncbi:MAG: T9SS type A sorting domain-containing protein, partial [Chitinophagales bacterium]